MTTLEKFYGLVEDIEIAMMTTRRLDGHLRSRPMATQQQAAGADLWFVTRTGTAKLQDLSYDAHLNLAFFRAKKSEWISVSGRAEISRDRATIHQLYAADWRMWFPDEGDPRHGTPDDPRLTLIGVTIHAAEFLAVDAPRPVVLYELAKGWITGTEPSIGEVQSVIEPRRPQA